MNKDKNIATIGSTLVTAKASLERKMMDIEALKKAEVDKQTVIEQKKLLEAMEDPEKLSPTHAKQKLKQQQKIITGFVTSGVVIGVAVLAMMVLSPPTVLAIGGYFAGSFLANIPAMVLTATIGIIAGAATTAAGYGLGIVQSKLMPFTPTLLTEQKTEIENKVQKEVETEMISSYLCQLRLERTTGKLNQLEFAEVCEAMYDLAILQHKIPESIAQKLRDSAQEARAIHKGESQEKREEEKLELDKKKAEKQEARDEVKEKMSLRELRKDMELKRALTISKIQRGANDNNPLLDLMQLAGQLWGGAKEQ